MTKKFLKLLILILLFQSNFCKAVSLKYLNWKSNLDNKIERVLFQTNNDFISPSINNNFIFFTDVQNEINSNIYLYDKSGGIPRPILKNPYSQYSISATTFSNKAVFISHKNDSRGDLYSGLISKNGKIVNIQPIDTTLGVQKKPKISADGRMVAYISGEENSLIIYDLVRRKRIKVAKFVDDLSFGHNFLGYVKHKGRGDVFYSYNLLDKTKRKVFSDNEILSPTINYKSNIVYYLKDSLLYSCNNKNITFLGYKKKIIGDLFFNNANELLFFFSKSINSKRELVSLNPSVKNSIIVAQSSKFQYWYGLDMQKTNITLEKKVDIMLSAADNFKRDIYTQKAIQNASWLVYSVRSDSVFFFIDEMKKKYKGYSDVFLFLEEYYKILLNKKNTSIKKDGFAYKYLSEMYKLKNGEKMDLNQYSMSKKNVEYNLISQFEINYILENLYFFWQFNDGIKFVIQFLENNKNGINQNKLYDALIGMPNSFVDKIYNNVKKYDAKKKLLLVKSVNNFLENGELKKIGSVLSHFKSYNLKNEFIDKIKGRVYNNIKSDNELNIFLKNLRYIRINRTNSYFIYHLIFTKTNEENRDRINKILKQLLFFNDTNKILQQTLILNGGELISTKSESLNMYLSALYYYVHNNKGNLKKALKFVDKYILLKGNDYEGYLLKSNILVNLGIDELDRESFKEAEYIYRFLENNISDKFKWIIYFGLAELYSSQDKNISAIENYKKAILYSDKILSTEELGKYQFELARLFAKNSQYSNSLKFLKKAKVGLKKNYSGKYLSLINKLFVYIYQLSGEYEKANDYLSKLVNGEKEKNKFKDYSNLSVNYMFTEDYDFAYKNALVAEDKLNSTSDFQLNKRIKVGIFYPFIPTIKLNEIGKARFEFSNRDEQALLKSIKWKYYMNSGRIFQSKDDLLKKLSLAKKEDDKLMQAIVYNNLAYYYMEMGDLSSFNIDLEKSLQICVDYYLDDIEFQNGLIKNLMLYFSFNPNRKISGRIHSIVSVVDSKKMNGEFSKKFKMFISLFLFENSDYLSRVTGLGILDNINKYGLGNRDYRLKSFINYQMYINFGANCYLKKLYNYNEKIGKKAWNYYLNILFDKGNICDNFNKFYSEIAAYEELPVYFDEEKFKSIIYEYIKKSNNNYKIAEIYEKMNLLFNYIRLRDIKLKFKSEYDKNYYNMFRNFYSGIIFDYRDSIAMFSDNVFKYKKYKKKLDYYLADMKKYINEGVSLRNNYFLFKLVDFKMDTLVNRLKGKSIIYSIAGRKFLLGNGKNKIFITDDVHEFNKEKCVVSIIDYFLLSKNRFITRDTAIIYSSTKKMINAKSLLIYKDLKNKKRIEYCKLGNEYFLDFIDRILNIGSVTFFNSNIDVNNISMLSKLLSIAGCRGFYVNGRYFGETLNLLRSHKYHKKELVLNFQLAKQYNKRKDYKIALKKILQAKTILDGGFDEKYGYYVDFLLAEIYQKNGMNNEALSVLSERLKKLNKNEKKYYERYFKIIFFVNNINKKIGYFSANDLLLRKAIDFAIKNMQVKNAVLLQYQMAENLVFLKKYSEAVSFYNRVAKYYKDKKNMKNYFFISKKIANIYMNKLLLFSEATKYYNNLLLDSLDNKYKIIVLFELSGLNIKQGRFQKANSILSRAKTLIYDEKSKGLYYLYKLQWAMYSGNIDVAKKLIIKLNEKYFYIYKLNFEIGLFLFEDNVASADSLNNLFYEAINNKKNHEKYSSYLINRGWISFKKEKYLAAEKDFKDAVSFDLENNSKREQIISYKHLFAFYYFIKDYSKINKLYKEFKKNFPRRIFINYYDIIEYYVAVSTNNIKKLSILSRITENKDILWRMQQILIKNRKKEFSISDLGRMISNDKWDRLKWNWNYFKNGNSIFKSLIENRDSLFNVYIAYKKVKLAALGCNYDKIYTKINQFDTLNCFVDLDSNHYNILKLGSDWALSDNVVGENIVFDNWKTIAQKDSNIIKFVYPFFYKKEHAVNNVISDYFDYVSFYTNDKLIINCNGNEYGSGKEYFLIWSSGYNDYWQKELLYGDDMAYLYFGDEWNGYYFAKEFVQKGLNKSLKQEITPIIKSNVFYNR